ncbi:hypothetical protein [Chryseobacterium pennipullorum]|uniref:Uncharacterized protein n=1 Tax=Chryseobacterium pennipullorum TaxID=2258963 RepID=A0A3D9AVB4_9FLAO|nr:hypothetical protein [Chryseobacterium pennipullorum]REC45284.1 hypothetical protein DRF67_16495 [Chryseobacterium pennipullorum]
MRNISLILFFAFFCQALQGQSQQYIFNFNPKKFIRENSLEMNDKKEVVFNLYDINGRETKYITVDKTSDALRKAKIYSFKGKSEDGTKLITLTIASGKLSGSYLENGKAYYIEPAEKNCRKKYRIYLKPNGDYQVGQPNDVLK